VVVHYTLKGCILQLAPRGELLYFAQISSAHLTIMYCMSGFSNKIRAIRMMKGIKQSEIAYLLNVKQQSISKIENGKIQIGKDVADKIARHLGFSNQSEMEAFYETHINSKSSKTTTAQSNLS
jgi:DNA-binding XRE family transcriptional regulator